MVFLHLPQTAPPVKNTKIIPKGPRNSPVRNPIKADSPLFEEITEDIPPHTKQMIINTI
jgi:hypothetical protein